ncbi:MAG: 1-acyl-sn-glycerol-3-phosphate acyltransferase [Clostridia bacterium]|nr:1-acyl-sn-glycerol-3-phosphate acyltransferase [Clostridia bacterium]
MREFFRWLALITAWPAQLLFFKRKTYYEDRSVQGRIVKGGALIISNHYCVLDYMMNLFLFPGRKLYVVLAELVYKRGKFYHWAMPIFGGIRSDRDVMGMRFIDDSVAVLEKGKIVQIYPEARNTDDGLIHAFKPSYILIALRADVPIIPVIIDGNYGFTKRAHVIIGKPIRLSEHCSSLNPGREEIVALNDMVQSKVQALKNELDRRIAEKKKKRKRENA